MFKNRNKLVVIYIVIYKNKNNIKLTHSACVDFFEGLIFGVLKL